MIKKCIFSILLISILMMLFSISTCAVTFTYDSADKSTWNLLKTWDARVASNWNNDNFIKLAQVTPPTETLTLTGNRLDIAAGIMTYLACSNHNWESATSIIMEVKKNGIWENINGTISGNNVFFQINDLNNYVTTNSDTIPVRLSWKGGSGHTAWLFERIPSATWWGYPTKGQAVKAVTKDFVELFYDSSGNQKGNRSGIFNHYGANDTLGVTHILTQAELVTYNMDSYSSMWVSNDNTVMNEVIYNIKLNGMTLNLKNAYVFAGDTITYPSGLTYSGAVPALNWTKSNAKINITPITSEAPSIKGITKGNTTVTLTATGTDGNITQNKRVTVLDIANMKNYLLNKSSSVEQIIPIEVPINTAVNYNNFSFELTGDPGFASVINHEIKRYGDQYILKLTAKKEGEVNLTLIAKYLNSFGQTTSKQMSFKAYATSINAYISNMSIDDSDDIVLFKGNSLDYKIISGNQNILNDTALNVNVITSGAGIEIIGVDKTNKLIKATSKGNSVVSVSVDSPTTCVGQLTFTNNLKVIEVPELNTLFAFENSSKLFIVPFDYDGSIDLEKLAVILLNHDGTVINQSDYTCTLHKFQKSVEIRIISDKLITDSSLPIILKFSYTNKPGFVVPKDVDTVIKLLVTNDIS